METIKVLAKRALKDVGVYVTMHWQKKAYMDGNNQQLGYMDLGGLTTTRVLSFSQSLTGLGVNLDLKAKKVDAALELLMAIDNINLSCFDNDKNKKDQKRKVFIAAAGNFSSVTIKTAKEKVEEARATAEPKSLDAALKLGHDVFDDFLSPTKDDLLDIFNRVYNVEFKSRDENGKFVDESKHILFGYVIRLFSTLVDFVRESHKELAVRGSSLYPNQSNAMTKVMKELKDQIRLLDDAKGHDTFLENAKELKMHALAMHSIFNENGFTEVAEEYHTFANEIINKKLSGEISDKIQMFPSEAIAPKVEESSLLYNVATGVANGVWFVGGQIYSMLPSVTIGSPANASEANANLQDIEAQNSNPSVVANTSLCPTEDKDSSDEENNKSLAASPTNEVLNAGNDVDGGEWQQQQKKKSKNKNRG